MWNISTSTQNTLTIINSFEDQQIDFQLNSTFNPKLNSKRDTVNLKLNQNLELTLNWLKT